MLNIQRAITPKVDKPELRFMCSASHLIMLYICVKFLKVSQTVSVMTGMTEALTDGHPNSEGNHIKYVHYSHHFLRQDIKMIKSFISKMNARKYSGVVGT